ALRAAGDLRPRRPPRPPARWRRLRGHTSLPGPHRAPTSRDLGRPRTPKSSSASSATNRLLTSPLPLSGLLGLLPSLARRAHAVSAVARAYACGRRLCPWRFPDLKVQELAHIKLEP